MKNAQNWPIGRVLFFIRKCQTTGLFAEPAEIGTASSYCTWNNHLILHLWITTYFNPYNFLLIGRT